MTAPPLAFAWNGEQMVPLKPQRAARSFEKGRIYWLEEATDRSLLSHQHQFAWLNEAWRNLPERLADLYPTPEHLRKHALIEAGFYREQIIDAGSQAAAHRVAAYAKGEDEFAHVVTRGPLVVVRKARSQRMHGHERMGRKEFQDSKTAVLEIVAGLIGVKPEEVA